MTRRLCVIPARGGSVGINVTNTINGVVGNFDATLTGYQA